MNSLKMENYKAAALRHWIDATILETENSLGNADHLFGFAAECAIKTTLVKLPAFAKSGELQHEYKEHINTLWEKAKHHSIQKTHPKLAAILKTPNQFSDWNVNQRYFADGEISKAAMESHKRYARTLLGNVGILGIVK